MGWKCPRCNTVHPYSVRKCPCGDASSSRKKASPPTPKGKHRKPEAIALELAEEAQKTIRPVKQTKNLEIRTKSKELNSDLNTLSLEDETSNQVHEHFRGAQEIVERENSGEQKGRRQNMRKCPYCAEDIREEAIKCRYCGEFLTDRISPKKSTLEKGDSATESTRKKEPRVQEQERDDTHSK